MNKCYYTLGIIATLLLIGCNRPTSEITKEIIIQSFEHEFSLDSVVEECIILPIQPDGMVLGEIIDATCDEERVYALDSYGTISITNIKSGVTNLCRNLIGEGPGECVAPNSIAYHKENIYVYDLATRNVSLYNALDLAFKGRISVDVSAMDFAVTDSMMAFSNIDLRGGESQLILTDTLGVTIKKLFKLSKKSDIFYALTNNNLYTYKGKVFFTPLWENKFYGIYKDCQIGIDEISIKFDKFQNSKKETRIDDAIEADKHPIVLTVFQNNEVAVTQFLYKDFCYYNFSINGENIACGRTATKPGIPFVPKWQSEKYLIGATSDTEWIENNMKNDYEDSTTYVFLYKLRRK